jgi:hypothetical protein
VQSAANAVAGPDPKRWIWKKAKTRQPSAVFPLEVHYEPHSQWRERIHVERTTSLEIRDREINVMNHGCSLTPQFSGGALTVGARRT